MNNLDGILSSLLDIEFEILKNKWYTILGSYKKAEEFARAEMNEEIDRLKQINIAQKVKFAKLKIAEYKKLMNRQSSLDNLQALSRALDEI